MPTVSAVTTSWNGFPGAPGYTKFYFLELVDATARQAAVDSVRTFFLAFANQMKSSWSLQTSNIIQGFDVVTGQLVNELTSPSLPAAVTGLAASSQSYSGGAGLLVRWTTGTVVDGRKLQGRTYMVPLVLTQDTDGTIAGAVLTSATAAASALIAATGHDLAVWHRRWDGGHPATQIGGVALPATGASVPDRTAMMRSRRD